jgi:hypothetical protein
LGHRRSVAETIERRFPSARRRPGAWHLPVLAPGRMRAQPRVGSAARMSLWERAPREVYRVYGEDQYVDGETASPEDQATVEFDPSAEASGSAFGADGSSLPHSHGSASTRASGPHAGRLLGIGLLVGVSLATLALVVSNVLQRNRATPRPPAQGARVWVGQRATRTSGSWSASAISRGASFRPLRTSRSPDSPNRVVASQPFERDRPSAPAPYGTLRPRSASSATLRPPDEGAYVQLAPQRPTPVAVESPVQDEFGFER